MSKFLHRGKSKERTADKSESRRPLLRIRIGMLLDAGDERYFPTQKHGHLFPDFAVRL